MDAPWKNEKAKIVNFPICQSSPKAIAKIKDTSLIGTGETEQLHSENKYPFRLLKIGESFTASISVTVRANLAVCAANYGKRTGKKFAVFYWKEYECFEVARIA